MEGLWAMYKAQYKARNAYESYTKQYAALIINLGKS